MYSFRDGQPQLSDYAAIEEFDWSPIQPRSYLSPMNSTFGNYDVLLDGHSHSTYSDGRMSPETLIKWHIGESFSGITDRRVFKVSNHLSFVIERINN